MVAAILSMQPLMVERCPGILMVGCNVGVVVVVGVVVSVAEAGPGYVFSIKKHYVFTNLRIWVCTFFVSAPICALISAFGFELICRFLFVFA